MANAICTASNCKNMNIVSEGGPVARQPDEIGLLVRGIGHYVLDRKVQFHGGETVGTEENPIGRIELGRTAVGADSQAVYRVVLAEAENG